MATITTTDASFVDLDSLPDLVNTTAGLYSAYHTNGLDVVASRDEAVSIVLKGTGFDAIDGHGFETAGTITEIDIFVSGIQFVTITDLSVSAADLATVFADGDVDGFSGLLFGGDDHFVASANGGNFQGYAGDDTMVGSNVSDAFDGGDGADVIRGKGGVDVIIGENGGDILFGGAGRDVFAYLSVSDSTGTGIDTIKDLQDNDKINLSSIDAKTGDNDDAFVLVDAFDGAAGELTLTYDAAHHRTVIGGDVDGDEVADLTIYLSGNHTDFTHFVL